ncbi:MAG: protein kinase [Verrucomicrobia bacterium]|nr:protein kinase [Verrucomicrobiota bacterium]
MSGPLQPGVTCARCHSTLSGSSVGGNCPACLVGIALGEPVPEDVLSEREGGLPGWMGSYEILSEVGRGGSSVVYRARQRGVNRVVALKVLQGAILHRRDALERLRVEAEAIGRLEHPHIVPLYEVGRSEGLPFLVLRLHEHGSLADALKRGLPAPEMSARIVKVAAEAVHHAHLRGVLHRDLKPSNLLLDAEGLPHVSDFGLAKLADGDAGLTLSTSVLGTPAYMAPEQAEGRTREVGVPADVHALGVILFELLTGRVPFEGGSAVEILRRVAENEPPRLRSIHPGVDPDLEAICLHCLEKRPDRRYSSAAELAADLGRWLSEEPIAIRPGTSVQRFRKMIVRRPLVSALAFAASVFLVGGLAVSTWQWGLARQAASLAQAAELKARQNSYVADMMLASSELDRNPGRVRELLDRHRPVAGQSDLRGWEWRYLWGAIRPGSLEILCRRSRSVFSLTISVDGRWAGIGEFNGGFSLWDLQSGQEVWKEPEPMIEGGSFDGTRVAASPTEGRLAYSFRGSNGVHQVRVLDVATRQIVHRFPIGSSVRMLAGTRDGSRWIVTTAEGTLQVWDGASGRQTQRWPVPLDPYWVHNRGAPLAISPDGLLAAVDDQQGGIRVLELETGVERHRFKTSRAQVLAMAFSPDGRRLAAGASYNEPVIRIWNLEDGRMEAELVGHHGWISGLAFLSGDRLLSTSQDQSIRIWDVPNRSVLRVLRGHGKEVWSFALGPGADLLLSGSKDGEVRRWSLQSEPTSDGAYRASLSLKPWETHATPDGRELWSVNQDGIVCRMWGPGFRRFELRPEFGSRFLGLRVAPDGRHLWLGDEEGRIMLRRLEDGGLVRSIQTTPGSRPGVNPRNPTQVYLYSAADSRIRRLAPDWSGIDGDWAAPEGFGYMDWRVCRAGVLALQFGGEFELMDFESGASTRGRLQFRESMGFSVSPDHQVVAIGTDVGEVHLMTPDLDRELGRLGGYLGAVRGLAFSPDGRRLATGASGLESLRVWDLETLQPVLQLPSETMLIYPLRFTPDGNTIWGVGVYGDLVTWTAPDWNEIHRTETKTADWVAP